MFGIPDNDDLDVFSDAEIVAKTLYGEARGEIDQGRQAVANVIANRVNSPVSWWGKTFRTVCLTPYQFSCWLPSDPNRAIIVAATDADAIYQQCLTIANLAIDGKLDDITNGADSYLRTGTDAPWSRTLTPVAVIGHHSFYITVKNVSS